MDNGFLFGLAVGTLVAVMTIERDTAKKIVKKGKKLIDGTVNG